MINLEAVKLRTLANKPTLYKNLSIAPKTLNSIIDVGYEEYNHKLYIVNLAVENLLLPTEEEVKVDFSMIELLMGADSDSLVAYLSAISFFINEEIGLSPDGESLIIGKETFSFKEVDDITDIIKIQNCVITKVDDFNPLNENVKKLREKMLARQRKLRELKGDDDEGKSLSFLDLISILCSNANGINIMNVFDLNFFQFNDQFNRMKLLDDYNVNVQALLHGADPKKTKLTHWMSKIG